MLALAILDRCGQVEKVGLGLCPECEYSTFLLPIISPGLSRRSGKLGRTPSRVTAPELQVPGYRFADDEVRAPLPGDSGRALIA